MSPTRLSALLVVLTVLTSHCSCFTPYPVYNKDGRSIENFNPSPYQYYKAYDKAEPSLEPIKEYSREVEDIENDFNITHQTQDYQTISINIPKGLPEGISWVLVPVTNNRRSLNVQGHTEGGIDAMMDHHPIQAVQGEPLRSLLPVSHEHAHQEDMSSMMKPFGRNGMIPIPGSYSKEISFVLNHVFQKFIYTLETVFGGVLFFMASTMVTIVLIKALKGYVQKDTIHEALGTDNFMKMLVQSVEMYNDIIASDVS